MPASSSDTNWGGACGISGKMPSSKAVKQPEVRTSSQYTKTESFYSESNPEVDN
jgi:hypothetical protein